MISTRCSGLTSSCTRSSSSSVRSVGAVTAMPLGSWSFTAAARITIRASPPTNSAYVKPTG